MSATPMKQFLKSEVAQILRLMDNSDDTSGAIRKVLFGVYTLGVKRGAAEGYLVGYADGKRGGSKAGGEAVARRVVSDSGNRASG